MTLRLPSLTAAEAVSETGRTLAAFQASDTLGSVSNVSPDYSDSETSKDVKGKQKRTRAFHPVVLSR